MAYNRPRREQKITSVLWGTLLAIVGGVGLLYLLLRLLSFGGPNLPGVPPQVAPPQLAVLGSPTPTAIPPTAVPTAAPTPAGPRPAVNGVAQRWVQAFEAHKYADLYGMLTAKAKGAVAQEKFVGRYTQVMSGASVYELKTNLPAVRDPDRNANRVDAPFTAHLKSGRFGEWDERYSLPIVWENNDWRIDWTPDLIFQGLAPGNSVRVFEDDPTRGNIVDKNGVPLAAQQKVPTLGVIPGQLKDKEGTIKALVDYLQVDPNAVRKKIDTAQADWWVPLGVFPPDKRPELQQKFGNVPGVVLDDKEMRVYPQGQSAAHIVGYTSPATSEDLKTLAARGYSGGEPVGRTGVEGSMDDALAGQRGGRLIIADDNGNTIRVIAERASKPGATVQLTLDMNVQRKTEEILGNKIGSMILMDPRDNSVLAMASNPRFDPNIFVYGISPDDWNKLNNDPRKVFQNRPAMSSYPTGSIFKVITMATGIERGGFQPGTQFVCNGSWNKLNLIRPMGDWIKTGHGRLDLSEGLTESCDIVFYDLGLKLWQTDPGLLPEYAHQFGLGEPTGINGLPEVSGILPTNDWKQRTLGEPLYPGDEVNLAIGQGYLEATPLQMANVYSTLAHNGDLRTPLLVKKVGPTQGAEPPKVFQAQLKRRVPVSQGTLIAIREAMKKGASTPRGTANYAFNGYRIPIAAKTGSAENQAPQAHAWFAGYGPADDPQLVVIVMVEGGEMGGVVAAPLARQAFEAVIGK